MADNYVANPGTGGKTFASDEIGGVDFPRVKVAWGVDGAAVDASATNPLPVSGPLTDAQLRAAAVIVTIDGNHDVTGLPPLVAGSARIGQTQLTGSATAAALGLGSSVTAYGNLRVTTEPTLLFNDPFDGAVIDTTDRWNAAVVASGMTVTQGGGGQVITTNTTASASAYIDSKPTFAPLGLAFLAFGEAIKLEAQTSNFFVTNQHRFWGRGDRPASFAYATPLKNAVGFEIDGTGQLRCVVYSNGTLVYSTATSLTGVNLNTLVTPSNGYCRFGIAERADTIVFYVGTTEYPAASFSVSSASFALPDVQALPIRHHAINNSTPPGAVSTLIFSNLAVGDTSGSGMAITDGVHGFRKAGVAAKNTQSGFALATQNMKDTGRNGRVFMLDVYTAAPVAEALQSVVQWYNNAAVAGTTTPAVVPAGKTLRLTTWSLSTKSLATVGSAVLRIRANTGGVAVIGSPLVWSAEVGSRAGATTVAMTGGLDQQSGVFPEGFEFPAGTGLGFTLAGYGPTGTLTLQGVTRFQVYGYEY